MSIDSVREMLTLRVPRWCRTTTAARPGASAISCTPSPCLLERLNGFGPVRFRLFFRRGLALVPTSAPFRPTAGSEVPPSSCSSASPTVIGLRQVLRPLARCSASRRSSRAMPASRMMVQAFQIDIDHWRHIYLMLGAVWGIEAARLKWAGGGGRPRPKREHGRRKYRDPRAGFAISAKIAETRRGMQRTSFVSRVVERTFVEDRMFSNRNSAVRGRDRHRRLVVVAPAYAAVKMVGGAPMYPTKNIVENAVNSKIHTTLVAAVKAAGLVDTLVRPWPVHRVRADQQAAFDKLPKGTVAELAEAREQGQADRHPDLSRRSRAR